MEQMLNAWESWSLYDTVLIGPEQDEVSGAKWYTSFAQLSNETEIPFLNQRNRSTVGVPYCNLDSAEQIPFGFECWSIGVEISTPPTNDLDPDVQGAPFLWNPDPNYWLFGGELLKHCALRFQVSQDEKLLCNVLAAPPGSGKSGYFQPNIPAYTLQAGGQYHGFNNGVPFIGNRWKFAEPVRIPRNRNIAAWVQFSTYARGMLAKMVGPGRIVINELFPDPVQGFPTYESVSIPAVAMIRLSMFGKREVQQRNDLHF